MNFHIIEVFWMVTTFVIALEASPKPLDIAGHPSHPEHKSCAEQCAEHFVKMVVDHPDYSSYQQKDESLKCIQQCRGLKEDGHANKGN